jgi:uncharacterized protein YqeY
MSETLTKLRIEFLDRRKARDTETAAFLSTIIGEIESNAKMVDGMKVVTEEDVVKVLKSFEKKTVEFLNIVPDSAKSLKEKEIIESFLPKQLTEQEILDIITQSGTDKNMGAMMKYLKDNYAGTYDGKTASKVVKEIVSG